MKPTIAILMVVFAASISEAAAQGVFEGAGPGQVTTGEKTLAIGQKVPARGCIANKPSCRCPSGTVSMTFFQTNGKKLQEMYSCVKTCEPGQYLKQKGYPDKVEFSCEGNSG